jgi:hypothetical protein
MYFNELLKPKKLVIWRLAKAEITDEKGLGIL